MLETLSPNIWRSCLPGSHRCASAWLCKHDKDTRIPFEVCKIRPIIMLFQQQLGTIHAYIYYASMRENSAHRKIAQGVSLYQARCHAPAKTLTARCGRGSAISAMSGSFKNRAVGSTSPNKGAEEGSKRCRSVRNGQWDSFVMDDARKLLKHVMEYIEESRSLCKTIRGSLLNWVEKRPKNSDNLPGVSWLHTNFIPFHPSR